LHKKDELDVRNLHCPLSGTRTKGGWSLETKRPDENLNGNEQSIRCWTVA